MACCRCLELVRKVVGFRGGGGCPGCCGLNMHWSMWQSWMLGSVSMWRMCGSRHIVGAWSDSHVGTDGCSIIISARCVYAWSMRSMVLCRSMLAVFVCFHCGYVSVGNAHGCACDRSFCGSFGRVPLAADHVSHGGPAMTACMCCVRMKCMRVSMLPVCVRSFCMLLCIMSMERIMYCRVGCVVAVCCMAC